MSQKFCKIFVTWSPVRLYRMLLLRSWRWRTTRNCKMLELARCSPRATRWICLCGSEFGFRIHGFRPIWPWLIIEIHAHSLNYMFTVLWSTAHPPFEQLIFLFISAALWLSLKSQSIGSCIRLHWTFFCTFCSLQYSIFIRTHVIF